jgi:YVTN family beta-propeller protein
MKKIAIKTIALIAISISLFLLYQNTLNNFVIFSQAPPSSISATTTKNQSQIIMPDHIYTTQRKDNSIYDLQKNITIPAGKDMTYVDVTADGKIVAATSSGDNQTFIFNGTDNKLIGKVKVGEVPKGVKITPDKNYVFVANELSGSVSIINLKDLRVIKEIKVGPVPHNIVFSPNGTKAFVTIQGGDKIAIIDTKTLENTGEIEDSKGPHNLDITNDGKLLFVANAGSSNVAVINTTSLKI